MMKAIPSLSSPLQPKSDVSDFGHLTMPNSGRPEFGLGEVGPRSGPGEGILTIESHLPPHPARIAFAMLATLSPQGRGK